jgi:hypothetical protein
MCNFAKHPPERLHIKATRKVYFAAECLKARIEARHEIDDLNPASESL